MLHFFMMYNSISYIFSSLYSFKTKEDTICKKETPKKLFLYAFFCMLLYFSFNRTKHNDILYIYTYIYIFLKLYIFMYPCSKTFLFFIFYVVVVCVSFLHASVEFREFKKQHERTLLKEHCV